MGSFELGEMEGMGRGLWWRYRFIRRFAPTRQTGLKINDRDTCISVVAHEFHHFDLRVRNTHRSRFLTWVMTFRHL